ncbi:DUF4440 domain-containing protein [Thalassobacillus pellis]|uniref:nuclear transport factor 2 family protein n=1 Tax=Thalassobacillus pellis TaxID=748008 RepID=UPI00196064B1|nr:DUF4440 domain-containing protein [Thalassobacillus pellis]MBM7553067.1 hypothetical protein [Thalassobacillus pellis]
MEEQIMERLYVLETSLLKGEVRKSVEKLNKMLAEDFMEFASDGKIYDKENILTRLPKEDDPGIVWSNFEAKILSPTTALTTFKIFIQSKNTYSLRSSVWKWNDGRWQMVFHQGTLTEEKS